MADVKEKDFEHHQMPINEYEQEIKSEYRYSKYRQHNLEVEFYKLPKMEQPEQKPALTRLQKIGLGVNYTAALATFGGLQYLLIDSMSGEAINSGAADGYAMITLLGLFTIGSVAANVDDKIRGN